VPRLIWTGSSPKLWLIRHKNVPHTFEIWIAHKYCGCWALWNPQVTGSHWPGYTRSGPTRNSSSQTCHSPPPEHPRKVTRLGFVNALLVHYRKYWTTPSAG